MNENTHFDLKTYLLSNTYKSLIELFVSKTQYYNTLKKKGLVKDEAVSFLAATEKMLRDADENISIEAFRKLRYEEIVDE